MLTWKYIGVLP